MSELTANIIIYGGMAGILCMTVFFRLLMEMELPQNRSRLPIMAQLCATSYATLAAIMVSSFMDPTFNAVLDSSFAGEWIAVIFGALAFQTVVLLFGGVPFLVDTIKAKFSKSNKDQESSYESIRVPMTEVWVDGAKFAIVTSCLMVLLAASVMLGTTVIMISNGHSLDATIGMSSGLGISIILPFMLFFRAHIAKSRT